MNAWNKLNQAVSNCTRCPRLIAHCQRIAQEKRAAYNDQDYWGGPVPNFGDQRARLLIVGLAPGAHGANRTGRMFTGDRSGLWLYRSLHRTGFANQFSYEERDDGLSLIDCAITAVCHCAPPDNKPTGDEVSACEPFLTETWELLRPQVVVTLGQLAWKATFRQLKSLGQWESAVPKFGHLETIDVPRCVVIGSYHPSQQNTFTGRLTEVMLDAVFETAKRHLAATKQQVPRKKK
ncbi:MAG: uracil-DNA glycosylase [Pirellulaceae bacterium]